MRISDWSSDVCSSDLSSVIIQQAILPHFREGRMAEGILASADALIAQLQLPDEEAQARNAEAARLLAERDRGTGPAGFFWIIVVAVILIVIFSNRGVGRRFRGGRAPVVLWGPGFGGGGRGGFGGGGFSGGGGSFGGGGASGGW